MYKVLFVPGQATHVKMLDLVRKELDKHSVSAIGLNEEKVRESLSQLNFPFRRIEDYGKRKIKDIIKSENPDIVVAAFDTAPMQRLFVRAANKLNIPTLHVLEGPIFDWRYRTDYKFWQRQRWKLFFKNFISLINAAYPLSVKLQLMILYLVYRVTGRPLGRMGHGESLKTAVAGDSCKNTLVSQGVDASRIVVTGQPRFDELFQKNLNEEMYLNLGIDKDKKTILLTHAHFVEAGMWSQEEEDIFLSSIIRASSKVPNSQLIIKLHPWQDINRYRRFLDKESKDIILCGEDTDIYALINLCDVLLTVLSMTALEALIVNKPVIIIDLFGELESPYVQSGAAIGVSKKEDIEPVIEKALYNKEIRRNLAQARGKFVYDHAYKQDGKASKRVADLIIRMVKESKKA